MTRDTHMLLHRIRATASRTRPVPTGMRFTTIATWTVCFAALFAGILSLIFQCFRDETIVSKYQHSSFVTSTALAERAITLASVDAMGEVLLLRSINQRTPATAHLAGFSGGAVAISPDAATIAVGGFRVDQPGSRACICILDTLGFGTSSPDWLEVQFPPLAQVSALAYSRDGRSIFAGTTSYGPLPPRLYVIDIKSQRLVYALPTTRNCIMPIATSARGDLMAFAATDISDPTRPGNLYIVQVAIGEVLHQFDDPIGICALAFSRSGKFLACGNGTGRVVVRTTDSGKVVATIVTGCNSISDLAFSPTDEVLTVACLGPPFGVSQLSRAGGNSASGSNQIQLWDWLQDIQVAAVPIDSGNIAAIQVANEQGIVVTTDSLGYGVQVRRLAELIRESAPRTE